MLVDPVARETALTRWALPASVHIPIAAVDESAIANYIGEIERCIAPGSPPNALLVKVSQFPPVDKALPIWDLPQAAIFRQPYQLWVHVAYARYRAAYRKAFPGEAIEGKVLSHAMNRRTAALKGFRYVRLTPTSRASNSSSAFSEQWAVALHSKTDRKQAKNQAFIQYADICDLMLMMDVKLGGGVMELVNQGQRLVRPVPDP